MRRREYRIPTSVPKEFEDRLIIYKTFQNSLPANVWKKMSYAQRNAHKAMQAARNKDLRIIRAIAAVHVQPSGFTSAYRKCRTNRKIRRDVSMYYNDVAISVRKKLELSIPEKQSLQSAREVYAWKQTARARGVRYKPGKTAPRHLRAIFKFPNSVINKDLPYAHGISNNDSTKIIYWNIYLPVYYLFLASPYKSISISSDFVHIITDYSSRQVDRKEYGSIVMLLDAAIDVSGEGAAVNYELLKLGYSVHSHVRSVFLKEVAVIRLYSELLKYKYFKINMSKLKRKPTIITPSATDSDNRFEKRGYLKHIVRMRYRWFFQPKLSQFKLFKKFFKRSLKRYRKISKNKLFINKFRSHFPKLTGFTEKGLLQMWLPFRRAYNQYWSASNAVLRFSQSLLLTPTSLLVFLQLSPSFAASKYIIKSGAVSINGLAVTSFTQFRPGDIMQLNFVIWRSVRHFFDYQRWKNDFRAFQYISFLQVDWSSLMFMMIRWPRKYELVAPSFLSERWVRYYIRQFPAKIRNFKKADGNWKVYKRIVAKR